MTDNAYLFGINDGTFRIFKSEVKVSRNIRDIVNVDGEQTKPQIKRDMGIKEIDDFYGIGMYSPEVEDFVAERYERGMDVDELIEIIKGAINFGEDVRSKNENRAAWSPPLLGFASWEFSDKGLEEIEFTRDPNKLYFHPDKC